MFCLRWLLKRYFNAKCISPLPAAVENADAREGETGSLFFWLCSIASSGVSAGRRGTANIYAVEAPRRGTLYCSTARQLHYTPKHGSWPGRNRTQFDVLDRNTFKRSKD